MRCQYRDMRKEVHWTRTLDERFRIGAKLHLADLLRYRQRLDIPRHSFVAC